MAAPVEPGAAGAFWQGWMQRHRTLAGLLATIAAAFSFVFNGHIIVYSSRWVIRVCGYVAEGALLFAVLGISACSVAPKFVEVFISAALMQYLVWLALIVLSLIPEVLLFNAVIDAIGHWIIVKHRRRDPVAWSWACLFTVPTVLFFFLTAFTLNTVTAHGGNVIQASSSMLGLRCFTGWMYGLLQMVYAGVGRLSLQATEKSEQAQPQPVNTPSAQTPAGNGVDLAAILLRIEALSQQMERLKVEQSSDHQATGKVTPKLRDPDASADAPGDAFPESLQREMVAKSDATSDAFVNAVSTPGRSERSTQPLPKQRDPDSVGDASPLRLVNRKATQRNTRGEAVKRAERIIKRNPQITPTELAKRAHISRSYASQLLAQHSA